MLNEQNGEVRGRMRLRVRESEHQTHLHSAHATGAGPQVRPGIYAETKG